MGDDWKLGDDLYTDSNVLDPISFDDIILMAQNDRRMYDVSPDERSTIIKKLFNELLAEKLRDARFILNKNFSEIIDEVFPDEREKKALIETTENMSLTTGQRELLAKEIYEFLLRNEMWIDVSIYYNGKCMSTSDGKTFRYNGQPFVTERSPYDVFDYIRKPNILSMTFEGTFYEVMNDCIGKWGYERQKEFSSILNKHGLYYELGNAWNLSCYTI